MSSRTTLSISFAFALLLLSCAACSSSDSEGTGTVSFSIWGEPYIEDRIPAEVFEDGWSIKYNKFLVTVGPIRVADARGEVVAEMEGSKLFDMTKPGVKPIVTFSELPAKSYEQVSFDIAPASEETEVGAANEADKQLLLAGGFSVYVDAVATKGELTKEYAWGFDMATAYRQCKAQIGGKEVDGVVVTNGGTDDAQITIHGDHLYYDDLQDPESKVRFDHIAAADANDDGTVTLAELAAVELATIPRGEGAYGTGSAEGVNDLEAFHTALSRTIGHWRGEGECFSTRL